MGKLYNCLGIDMSVPNRFHDSADQADPVKRSDHVESVCRIRYRLPDFHGYL